MERCPICGSYMNSSVQKIFGGARIVWFCHCGYSTEEMDNRITYSNHTEPIRKISGGIGTWT